MRSFRSDNNAGLCREALDALVAANDGSHRVGYGDDEITARAVAAFREIFGVDCAVFFVATGTAANVLALASLTDSWQRIVCHEHSHLAEDESTAPERITGCRITTVATDPSKVLPADVQRTIDRLRGDVHQAGAGALSLSNATELGTVYTTAELRELGRVAHDAGFAVHVDGARFANAVASQGVSPRELASEVGVDALSFGGTKNGLAAGEAVLFFPQQDGTIYRRSLARFEHLRKSSGHLLSKHRFVSAPFVGTLDDGVWLRHAAHANRMAQTLAEGLRRIGLSPAFPVESNAVFVRLPPEVDRALGREGYGYYPFGDPEHGLSRLMCSFDTTEDEVERFCETARRA